MTTMNNQAWKQAKQDAEAKAAANYKYFEQLNTYWAQEIIRKPWADETDQLEEIMNIIGDIADKWAEVADLMGEMIRE